MSEDRFFSQVRETLHDYAPEVPQGVYGAMRKKLWWSNFTKLSATRFNMWYALLIVGAGSFLIAKQYSDSTCQGGLPAITEGSAIPKFKSFDTICAPKATAVVGNSEEKKNVSADVNSLVAKTNFKNSAQRQRNIGAELAPAQVAEIPATERILHSEMPQDSGVLPMGEISEEVIPATEIPAEVLPSQPARKGTPFLVPIPVDDSLKVTEDKNDTQKKD